MRYTRYNYKKKSNNNGVIKFIVSMVITIAIAGIIGIGLAMVIFKILPVNNAEPVNGKENTETVNQTQDGTTTETNVNTDFNLIQCGYFSNQDNANQVLSKIGTGYGSFVATEDGKYRVIAGIYSNDDAQKALDDLSSKGVESVKVSVKLNSSDEVQSQIAGICDGYLKILTTTFTDDFKSIKTQDFKDWVSKLENITEGENSEILSTLKTYVSELPEEINKEDVAKEMDYLYQVLSKFK